MTKANEIMRRAGVQLMDEEYVRWPLPELADAIDEAVREIVMAKPSSGSVVVEMSLVRGTKQTLPSDQRYVQLLDVIRNINPAGNGAGGRAVRPTTRALLDGQQPRWHDPLAVPFKPEVRQFVFDETLPTVFFTYPGNDGTGGLEINVSQLPETVKSRMTGDGTDISNWDFEIGLPDEYEAPLLEYVLYRAFDKEDPASSPQRATAHYQVFATTLGIKSQVETTATPNRRK